MTGAAAGSASGGRRILVGIDTGGTFTDFVLLEGEAIRIHKTPSTPDDPSRAVLAGLADCLRGEDMEGPLIHGSTVATNALLERKGGTTALVTTSGFEDVLEIGRQARRDIYDLAVTRPEPLVSAERRFGVDERMDETGRPLVALEREAIEAVVEKIERSGAESVAISLLHSYANPDHEHRIAEALRAAARTGERALFVTASSEVLPEFREYERTSTTAVNAFVGPVMARYLGRLAEALGADRVRVMASNGGVVALEAASRLAVQTILSGPAGGAVGGFEIARLAGYDRAITFDMGGTSTDVSLCAGGLARTSEAEIGGLPIRVPVIDIHTVGAGGGSIAWRDPGGSLRVGPESAGAAPGPICYGLGGAEVTVTDANLYLGRLSADHFLGGTQTLDLARAASAIEARARAFDLSPVEFAEGVVRVTNATMERAIRVISLERGHDPRDFALVCFGGAGGLHAADLALEMGIPRVLVPRGAGTLSALGMLMAEPVRDVSRTLLRRVGEDTASEIAGAFADLEARGRAEMEAEGWSGDRLVFERGADLRYVGQGFELPVSAAGDLAASFHAAHEARYGYADPGRPVEVVTIRVRVRARVDRPRIERQEPGPADATEAIIGSHRLVHGRRELDADLVDRDRLRAGHRFEGPAVVVEYSTTTVVPPGFRATVDPWRNLLLERSTA